jgi:superfamily II RNA helicase
MSRGGGGGPNSGAGRAAERAALSDLIHLLRSRDLLPTAIFCFSKKRCDAAADALSGLDLTTAAEKHASHIFVERCLSRLAEGDRKLPQVRVAALGLIPWVGMGRGSPQVQVQASTQPPKSSNHPLPPRSAACVS